MLKEPAYTAEPTPLLDTADEATGQQLEAEAAMQYRGVAAAAQAVGWPDACGRLSGRRHPAGRL